jgi:oligosaccharide repeat unit polymerase
VLATGAWAYARDWKFPPVIVSGVWAIVLVAFSTVDNGAFPVELDTILLILAGVSSFTVGALIALHGRQKFTHRVGTENDVNQFRTKLLILASAFGFPLFLWKAYLLASVGPTGNLLVDLRLAQTEDGLDLGIVKYLVPISCVAAATATAGRSAGLGKVWLITAYCCAVLYATASTARSDLILLLVSCCGIAIVRRQVSIPRVMAVGTVSVAIIWVGLAFLLRKGANSESDLTSNLQTLTDDFLVYLTGSIPALQTVLDSHPVPAWGTFTGRTGLAIAQALGFQVDVPALIKEYVWVPYSTNVYTVFEPYYRDFKVYGVMVSQAIFGWLHSTCYARAAAGDAAFQLLYGFLLFPAMTQFFADQYVSLLSLWIQVALLIAFVCGGSSGSASAPSQSERINELTVLTDRRID